jgi:hypothetical protein
MIASVWVPEADGTPRLRVAYIDRVRRIRDAGGVWGAFRVSAPGLGTLPECRLMRGNRGFFTTGEWLLDARSLSYRRFVEFADPFNGTLARAVRLELVAHVLDGLRERIDDDEMLVGELIGDDEMLLLDADELAEPDEPRRLDIASALRIEVPRQPGELAARRTRFDVLIGEAIRVKDCRLVGKPGSARLRLPTSDGLRLRPIDLDLGLQVAIVRLAESLGIPPIPFAA